MTASLSTRLEALLAVAARLTRAQTRTDAVRIATEDGVPAIGGRAGTFIDTNGHAGAVGRSGAVVAVPVRTTDATGGVLRAECDETNGGADAIEPLLASLAELLAGALDREARSPSSPPSNYAANDTYRFLAQASEALALSLDGRATLSTLARLLVPRVADWCVIDVATAEGTVGRSAVAHAEGEDASVAAALLDAPPERGAFGADARELLAPELTAAHELPADLCPTASAIGARSALVVHALGPSGGTARIALFTARSERHLGDDDFALAEELARRTSHALERAHLYSEALRANEAKDVFLATVSHELRGPLAATSMWSHVLGLPSCDEATRARAVQAIDESVRVQGRLIDDLLELSSLVTGKVRLEIAPLSAANFVRAAVADVTIAATAKGVALVCQAEADATVEGDSQRLRQVVANVLTNAIEFTPPAGKVEVSLACVPAGVRVVIADDGEGISPSSLPYLFTPFRQEDASLTRSRGGLGLGLAVAKQIVLLHGGTIYAESAGQDQGARFTVELPRAASMAPGSVR